MALSLLGSLTKKQKSQDTKNDVAAPTVTAFILIDQKGWKATFRHSDGGQVRAPISVSLEVEKEKDKSWKDIAGKSILRTFTKADLASFSAVHVLLDDPNIQIVDAKTIKMRKPSAAVLREFGAEFLGESAVCYGERLFGGFFDGEGGSFKFGDRQLDNLYAFSSAKSVRDLMQSLGDLAPKVAAVVPLVDALLRRHETQSEGGVMNVHMGWTHSHFTIANLKDALAHARTIPIGCLDILTAVSKANSVSLAQTRMALSERDFISEINPFDDAEGAKASVYQKALAPILRDFLSAANESIRFFSDQRGGGEVRDIELSGDSGAIKGLEHLLKSHLPGNVGVVSESLLEAYADSPAPNVNVLTGADGHLFTVGKVRYFFSDQKFVTKEDLAKEDLKISGGKKRSAAPVGSSNRWASKGDKASKVVSPQPGSREGGGLTSLLGKLKGLGSSPKEGDDDLFDDAAAQKQDRAGFMLVGLVCFGALYGGWTFTDGMSIQFGRAVSTYETAIKNSDELRREIRKLNIHDPRLAAVPETDKVLWSEKFLALAQHMNTKMWLTDVYLIDEKHSIGETAVLSKKLVLEGAVLPSTDGHLLEIANYIERLLSDHSYFMSDFREITFSGAQIQNTETDSIITFMVEAWYDQNKRLDDTEPGENGGDGTGLRATQRTVRDREEVLGQSVSSPNRLGGESDE
ncbi:MAG: hypothetical protein ACPGOV_15840 [Magnetovibrionaceae bacterium]